MSKDVKQFLFPRHKFYNGAVTFCSKCLHITNKICADSRVASTKGFAWQNSKAINISFWLKVQSSIWSVCGGIKVVFALKLSLYLVVPKHEITNYFFAPPCQSLLHLVEWILSRYAYHKVRCPVLTFNLKDSSS